MTAARNRSPRIRGLIDRGRRRYPRGPLYRPGDPRCCGPTEVELTDRYGYALRGCTRHAAQALRVVPETRITWTRRNATAADVQAWMDGRRPPARPQR